jgi:hypothetical protein
LASAVKHIDGNAIYPNTIITKYPGLQRPNMVLVCRQLIRNGTVKSPGDALRYLDENYVDIESLMEEKISHFQKQSKEKLPEK